MEKIGGNSRKFLKAKFDFTNCWANISVQFSRSVVFDSLRPHGVQHARLHYPSPTPGAYSNSCPSSWWCNPTISSSVIPSPPAFNLSLSQFFASAGQSIGSSASASVLPMNIKDWFPLGLTGLITLQSKGLLQHHSSKALILRRSAFFNSRTLTSIHDYWKNHSFD